MQPKLPQLVIDWFNAHECQRRKHLKLRPVEFPALFGQQQQDTLWIEIKRQ